MGATGIGGYRLCFTIDSERLINSVEVPQDLMSLCSLEVLVQGFTCYKHNLISWILFVVMPAVTSCRVCGVGLLLTQHCRYCLSADCAALLESPNVSGRHGNNNKSWWDAQPVAPLSHRKLLLLHSCCCSN